MDASTETARQQVLTSLLNELAKLGITAVEKLGKLSVRQCFCGGVGSFVVRPDCSCKLLHACDKCGYTENTNDPPLNVITITQLQALRAAPGISHNKIVVTAPAVLAPPKEPVPVPVPVAQHIEPAKELTMFTSASNNDVFIHVKDEDAIYDCSRGVFVKKTLELRAWMTDPARKQVRNLEFNPDRPAGMFVEEMTTLSGETLGVYVYNTFDSRVVMAPIGVRDPQVEQAFEYLLANLCDGDVVDMSTLRKWLAWVVRNPGRKIGYAVFLLGAEGTGKSALCQRVLAEIFGRYYRDTVKDDLAKRFNAQYLTEKLLVFNNETSRLAISDINDIITDSTISVERKGVDTHSSVRNCTNFIFAANDETALKLRTAECRRLFVVRSTTNMKTTAMGSAVMDAFGDSATCHQRRYFAQAVVNYLASIDLTDFDTHAPPQTAAKLDMFHAGASPQERWCRSELPPNGTYSKTLLWVAYKKWCLREGIKDPGVLYSFTSCLKNTPGVRECGKQRISAMHRHVSPSDVVCLQALPNVGTYDFPITIDR